MYKIGIVMRCYNKSKTIDLTLESVINSTLFKDILVVMVDDGSTDDSRSKLCEYTKKYTNMKLLVHDKNRGHFRASVSGIKYVHDYGHCEYLTILDTDDFITKGFYEALYNAASKENADIVNGKIYSLIGGKLEYNEWMNRLTIKKDGNYKPGEIIWCLCNKLLKVSLFDEFCEVIDDHMLYSFHHSGKDDYIIFLYLYKYIHKVCAPEGNEYFVYNLSSEVEHVWAHHDEAHTIRVEWNESIFKCCNALEF